MKVIFYNLLLAYFVIQTSRASSPKKHVYFQIDEFIKQLMTSEKFDELADVIADKAAQKIRNMENHNNSNFEKKSLRQSDKNNKKDIVPGKKSKHEDRKGDERDSESDEISHVDYEKYKKNESRLNANTNDNNEKEKGLRSEEKLKDDHESNQKKDVRSDEKTNSNRYKTESHSQKKYKNQKTDNFGKIDTQAFLQNHMASKELELNYKHLTGELGKHRYNVKDNLKKVVEKEYDREKHSKYNENNRAIDKHDGSAKNANTLEKIGDSQEVKSDSKEFKLSDETSNENTAHEQATFHDLEEKIDSREIKLTNDSDSANIENKNSKFKYNAKHSDDKPIPRVEGQDSEHSFEIRTLRNNYDNTKTLDDGFKNVSQEMNTAYSSSKEIVEVRINRANSEEVSPSHENLNVPLLGLNTSKHKQKALRKDNRRHYTPDTSLEYAEYHENVAKQNQPKYINL